jgi:hypothetical protein
MTAIGVSMGTVSKVVVRATLLGLDWATIERGVRASPGDS